MAIFTVGSVLAAIILWLVLALPLWISVKLLGSDAGLVRTAIIGVILLILQMFIRSQIGGLTGNVIAYIAEVLVIMGAFGLSLVRAIIATILPFILVAAFAFLLGVTQVFLY